MFREVSVVQVKELLRRWLATDDGLRRVSAGAGVDRKTARRYIDAAEAHGATRAGGLGQLTDELVAQVTAAVCPGRPGGHGQAWAALEAHHDLVAGLVGQGLTVAKVGDLVARRGIVVPERTLQRYCAQHWPAEGKKGTVPLADPLPARSFRPTSAAWAWSSTRPCPGGEWPMPSYWWRCGPGTCSSGSLITRRPRP